jgi:hypothetical protein
LIVTGRDCYRFIKKLENDSLKVFYKEITSQKNLVALDLDTNITCHCWLGDGRFILCNEKGQIMLMEGNGDFKQFTISASNRNAVPICSVIPYTMGGGEAGAKPGVNQKTGFIIATLGGLFRVFVKTDNESRQPYRRVEGDDLFPAYSQLDAEKRLEKDLSYMKVPCMALSPREDALVFTMSSN